MLGSLADLFGLLFSTLFNVAIFNSGNIIYSILFYAFVGLVGWTRYMTYRMKKKEMR